MEDIIAMHISLDALKDIGIVAGYIVTVVGAYFKIKADQRVLSTEMEYLKTDLANAKQSRQKVYDMLSEIKAELRELSNKIYKQEGKHGT